MCKLSIAMVLSLALSGGSARPFDVESAYTRHEISGFTVLVNARVAEHEKAAAEVLREIEGQLNRIVKVLGEEQLKPLRKVRIWVEWEAKLKGGAEFHVSAGWLKANGYNPAKLEGIEINNTRNFVAWTRKDQPWALMHEMGHAYHFTVLGAKHKGIAAAYQQAMERKLYDKVKHVNGRTQKAYAATNAAEYFAELTEAYLGKNDFEPFTRKDLETHDPVGYKLMQDTWGRK